MVAIQMCLIAYQAINKLFKGKHRSNEFESEAREKSEDIAYRIGFIILYYKSFDDILIMWFEEWGLKLYSRYEVSLTKLKLDQNIEGPP